MEGGGDRDAQLLGEPNQRIAGSGPGRTVPGQHHRPLSTEEDMGRPLDLEFDGSSVRGILTGSGTDWSGAAIDSTSSGTARYTAPGRSVCASLKALRIISGTAPGVGISAAHFVTGSNIETRSTL